MIFFYILTCTFPSTIPAPIVPKPAMMNGMATWMATLHQCSLVIVLLSVSFDSHGVLSSFVFMETTELKESVLPRDSTRVVLDTKKK